MIKPYETYFTEIFNRLGIPEEYNPQESDDFVFLICNSCKRSSDLVYIPKNLQPGFSIFKIDPKSETYILNCDECIQKGKIIDEVSAKEVSKKQVEEALMAIINSSIEQNVSIYDNIRLLPNEIQANITRGAIFSIMSKKADEYLPLYCTEYTPDKHSHKTFKEYLKKAAVPMYPFFDERKIDEELDTIDKKHKDEVVFYSKNGKVSIVSLQDFDNIFLEAVESKTPIRNLLQDYNYNINDLVSYMDETLVDMVPLVLDKAFRTLSPKDTFDDFCKAVKDEAPSYCEFIQLSSMYNYFKNMKIKHEEPELDKSKLGDAAKDYLGISETEDITYRRIDDLQVIDGSAKLISEEEKIVNITSDTSKYLSEYPSLEEVINLGLAESKSHGETEEIENSRSDEIAETENSVNGEMVAIETNNFEKSAIDESLFEESMANKSISEGLTIETNNSEKSIKDELPLESEKTEINDFNNEITEEINNFNNEMIKVINDFNNEETTETNNSENEMTTETNNSENEITETNDSENKETEINDSNNEETETNDSDANLTKETNSFASETTDTNDYENESTNSRHKDISTTHLNAEYPSATSSHIEDESNSPLSSEGKNTTSLSAKTQAILDSLSSNDLDKVKMYLKDIEIEARMSNVSIWEIFKKYDPPKLDLDFEELLNVHMYERTSGGLYKKLEYSIEEDMEFEDYLKRLKEDNQDCFEFIDKEKIRNFYDKRLVDEYKLSALEMMQRANLLSVKENISQEEAIKELFVRRANEISPRRYEAYEQAKLKTTSETFLAAKALNRPIRQILCLLSDREALPNETDVSKFLQEAYNEMKEEIFKRSPSPKLTLEKYKNYIFNKYRVLEGAIPEEDIAKNFDRAREERKQAVTMEGAFKDLKINQTSKSKKTETTLTCTKCKKQTAPIELTTTSISKIKKAKSLVCDSCRK